MPSDASGKFCTNDLKKHHHSSGWVDGAIVSAEGLSRDAPAPAGSGVCHVFFGVMVMVPLFYVDFPGDFSRADALTECEHAVHINSKCY
jgi:hypothetical protein